MSALHRWGAFDGFKRALAWWRLELPGAGARRGATWFKQGNDATSVSFDPQGFAREDYGTRLTISLSFALFGVAA